MIRPPPLVLRSLVVAVVFGSVLSGCPAKTEGGLLLTVTLEAGVRGDCVVVEGFEDGRRRVRSAVARDAARTEYFAGISRGDFPASMTWQASAVQGRCGDDATWKLSSRSPEVTRAFPASGVESFALTIGQPDATLDGDRDTFVDVQKGGTDCDDTNAAVKPGVPQDCASSVDTNCDGKLFCADSTCAQTATCLSPATGLVYESQLPTLVARDCSGPLSVQSVAGGMPAAVSADTAVTLVPTGTASAGLQLFSDTACATPLSGATLRLGFGTTRVAFSFRATTPGALSLTATAPGLGSTSLDTTITDRPVASLALTPTSLSARAGACSSAIDVTAVDDRMMPTNVSSSGLPLAVGFLPAGTSSVELFSDPSCTTPGAPPIPAGTSSTRLYLRGSRATPPGMPITVQVSSPTVNGGAPAALALTITAGAANRIEFTAAALGLRNNVCSQVMAEVELFDVNGNVTTAGPAGVDVTLAFTPPAAGGALQFFAAAGCAGGAVTAITIPANQSRVGVYLRAAGPGTYGVTATASALPGPATQLQVDVGTMDPTALVFPTPAVVVSTGAGTCSPGIRLQTRETNSTTSPVSPVVAPVVVSLSPSPAGSAALYLDSSCTTLLATNQVTLPAGSSEVTFYFRSNTARSLTLSASATNLSTTSPPQSARVTPAPTSKLVFQPPTSVSAVADGCSGGLGLLAFDTFDNPTFANGVITPAAAPSVALPAGVAFSAASNCSAATTTFMMADGGVTFFAKAQRAQQYSISATGLSSSTTTAATFTVDAGAPSVLRVATQPSSMLAAGSCTPVQVERLDAFMNPSPGAAQAYSVSATSVGTATVHGDMASCASGGAGPALGFLAGETRSAFFVRGRAAGTTAFTVTAAPAMVTTTNVQVLASAATELRFATGSPPATSAVGACAQATVERRDVEGNLTTLPTNLAATVTASGAGGMGLVLANSTSACGSTMQSSVGLSFGTATTTTFSYEPRATGALSFAVTSTGLASAMGSTTVGAGAVARVRFVSPPTMDQPYGGCVPLTLEALDVGNNPVTTPTNVMVSSSATGAFFTSTDCLSGMTNSVTVPASATVTFRYQPGALGAATLTATPSTGMSGTAMFNVAAGPEAGLQRTGFAPMTTAGTCVDFTVRRVDSGGNDAVGAQRTVQVTLSGAAAMASNEAQVYLGAGCGGAAQANPASIDIMAGASSATFSVRVRKAGALTLATSSAPLTAPADTSTTVVAGALFGLSFSTTPPASLGANVCSPIVTVNGVDDQGNPAALGTLALSMANATFWSAAGCSSGSLTQLVAGTATTASFYLRNPVPGPAISLTVGTAPSAVQSWNIEANGPAKLRWKVGAAPPSMLTRFTCSSAFRVEVADAADVAVTTSVARPLSFAPLAATGFRFFTDAACTTAVTGAFEIAAGQSESPDLYALSFANGAFSAIATDTTGMPLTATPSATVTVAGATPAVLSATPAATDLLYRTCTPVTLRRTVGGVDFTTLTTTVNVTVGGAPPATAYSLHTLSDCSDVGAATLPGVVIGSGSATATVYLRGRSAEPTGAGDNSSAGTLRTMTAIATDAAGFFDAGTSASISIHPAVRRGTCTIQNTDSSTATSMTPCTVSPALPSGASRQSFFTVQAVTAAAPTAPSDVTVQCVLDAPTPTAITCQRVGTSGVVNISWQLVTVADAVVLPLSGTLSGASGDQTLTLSEAVPSMGAAFVLYNAATSGTNFGADDNSTAELGSTTTVVLKSISWPTTVHYSAQVVQLPGVVVERGVSTFSMATSLSGTASTMAPGASRDGFVLHSTRFSAESGGEMCKFRLRSVVTSDTVLTFSRALGTSSNCNNATVSGISWERPAVPNTLASIQALPAVTINGNTTDSGNQNIGSQTLALDRVWSFVSGQGPGGQCGGETSVTSATPGYTQARISYNRSASNTRIVLTRGAQGGGNNSTFSLFALTFVQ
ncbi:MAG: putative metal-binding motif-containing protein [Myxococcus sp.]|nr:putative metal-binding motif-containing protein [Myxococcus sp.]